MTQSAQHVFQDLVLTVFSAILYVCFFQFNAWVFSGFEYSQGISWVFLPAGFRIILVLLLGLPGALGLVLASWYIDREMLGGTNQLLAILNGLVNGVVPWMVLKYFKLRNWVSEKLHALTAQQLLNMTIAFSAATAVAHQWLWLLLDRPNANPWVDVWPMFFGNVTGALLLLYSFKFVLDRARVKNPMGFDDTSQ
jgi:hypothetical protein